MTKYAQTARAAAKFVDDQKLSPGAAWDEAAAQIFPTQLASRAKSCPRQSFVALANAYFIDRSLAPTISGKSRNGRYALEAVQVLREHPELVNFKADLWARTSGGAKKHNSQMDVVIALWNEGYLSDPGQS
jgi:hypothetical protein